MIKRAYCGSRECNRIDWLGKHPGQTLTAQAATYKRILKNVPSNTAYCPDCQAVLFWKLVKVKKAFTMDKNSHSLK